MLGKLLVSFLISASPLGELKTGLPWALSKTDVNQYAALLFCIAGNLMVYPIIEYVMSNFGAKIFKTRWSKKKVVSLKQYSKSKTQSLVDKYGFWGLMIFVAVPLPGTGAYFGSIAAYVFGVEKKKAALAISIGIVITGVLYFAVLQGLIEGYKFLV